MSTELESTKPVKGRELAKLISRVQVTLDTVKGSLDGIQQAHQFKESLHDWVDLVDAAKLAGLALGVYPSTGEPTAEQENAMSSVLYVMVDSGLLELSEDDCLRWKPETNIGG